MIMYRLRLVKIFRLGEGRGVPACRWRHNRFLWGRNFSFDSQPKLNFLGFIGPDIKFIFAHKLDSFPFDPGLASDYSLVNPRFAVHLLPELVPVLFDVHGPRSFSLFELL